MSRKNDEKEKILISLKKSQSHIAKIIELVEKEEYCINIMQQNLAVMGLLRSAHKMIMKNHLNTCFRKAFESKNEAKKVKMIEEILKVTNLYNK